LRDVPLIQQSFAVILWRLDTVARDWTPVRGLARHILLRSVFEQLHEAMKSPYDKEEWILAGYVLDPLLNLGLIERKCRSKWPSVTENEQIRTSALWRKFIAFEPCSGGPSCSSGQTCGCEPRPPPSWMPCSLRLALIRENP
jgi:hypothetical protein